MSDPDDLDPADRQALLRWRLALGPAAEKVGPQFSLDALRSLAAGLDVDPSRVGDLDQALSFVYEEREAGLGASRPYIPRWLASLREFFRHDVVALVQKDAIEKKGLTQLLFEPETLPFLEKNVELVATLISAKGLIPDQAREAARQIVREVVDEVRRKLESRDAHGRHRRGPARPDEPAAHRPQHRLEAHHQEQPAGLGRGAAPPGPRALLLLGRTSSGATSGTWPSSSTSPGSMAESVVYASIMAAIFASLDVLRTRLLFFDTEIVDVTPLLDDPVDVLFASQLGGGTDIHRAVAYAQEHFIERPEKTLLLLISDLYEGGDQPALVARMRQLVDSRVKVVCLLALSDSGRPSYDHGTAAQLGRWACLASGARPGCSRR